MAMPKTKLKGVLHLKPGHDIVVTTSSVSSKKNPRVFLNHIDSVTEVPPDNNWPLTRVKVTYSEKSEVTATGGKLVTEPAASLYYDRNEVVSILDQ